MARPSDFKQETAALICERIADGESLRQICRTDGMPSKTTVLHWLNERQEFLAQYVRAREAQADHFAEEILDIADNAANDFMLRQQGEGVVVVVDHDHIARSRLRVDSRKWLMSKMAPKKYGERIDATVGNPDGTPLEDSSSNRQLAMAILSLLRGAASDGEQGRADTGAEGSTGDGATQH